MSQIPQPESSADVIPVASVAPPPGPSPTMLLTIVLTVILVPILFCGIGAWFWLRSGPDFGPQLKASYAATPEVVEAIGGIDTVEYDAMGTLSARGYVGDATVFSVTGPNGNAHLVLVQETRSSTELGRHIVYLRVGTTEYPLTPTQVPGL